MGFAFEMVGVCMVVYGDHYTGFADAHRAEHEQKDTVAFFHMYTPLVMITQAEVLFLFIGTAKPTAANASTFIILGILDFFPLLHSRAT